VSIQTDLILKKLTLRSMKKALNLLPPELGRLYDQVLQKLLQDDEYDDWLVGSVLALMLRGDKATEVVMLQNQIASSQGEDPIDSESLVDPTSIARCCGDLVLFNASDGALSFAHWTARAFLKQCFSQPQSQSAMLLFEWTPAAIRMGLILLDDEHAYRAPSEADEAGSTWGDELFSKVSTDETLVESERVSNTINRPGRGTIRTNSVSQQLVRFFVTDPEIETLVSEALDSIGHIGFERLFASLLKVYSKDLERIAQKRSQKEAALVVGQQTRLTATILRSALRPQDFADQERNTSVLNNNAGQDVVMNKLLENLDGGNVSQATTPKSTRYGNDIESEPHSNVEDTKEQQEPTLEDSEDDQDTIVVTANLFALNEFLTRTVPFAKLKLSLRKQIHTGLDLDSLTFQPDQYLTVGQLVPDPGPHLNSAMFHATQAWELAWELLMSSAASYLPGSVLFVRWRQVVLNISIVTISLLVSWYGVTALIFQDIFLIPTMSVSLLSSDVLAEAGPGVDSHLRASSWFGKVMACLTILILIGAIFFFGTPRLDHKRWSMGHAILGQILAWAIRSKPELKPQHREGEIQFTWTCVREASLT
jgi:hypothetical protein